jgi:Ca2+-transporting ATPase
VALSKHWLWGAILSSLVLQVAVIYMPPLQAAFGAEVLSLRDWVRCALVASSVLLLRERLIYSRKL